MEFEWDTDTADASLEKHGISFLDARSVFLDPNAFTVYDPDQSHSEDRFLTIGFSVDGRLLVVSHTNRNQTTRIISSRKATSREMKGYPNDRK